MRKNYHLSHTDLDGYGCQLVSKQYLDNCKYINANYGLEVKLSLETIIKDIKADSVHSSFFILISDLNLTLQESKNLTKEVEELNKKGKNISLQLLDHHATGKDSSDIYEWYYLDIDRCATKIVYDYFLDESTKSNYMPLSKDTKEWLENLVNAINAVDIWKTQEEYNFEFGKVCMQMTNKAREINDILFSDENREYRHSLLIDAAKFYTDTDGHIKLDNSIHFMKKDYLNLKDTDDTIDNISANYLVKLLETKKEELAISYKGHKGLLTYTLGSISIPANAFLVANDDYDFFIDVSRNGGASLRADGKVDVSLLAQKLAGGGGHKNASGLKFDDFIKTIHYSEVKKFVQDKLNRLK
jgi:oligoribonuclease NrnB/cAMP/cGMP phosphodiesterase (DHH superfamily)